MTDRDVLSATIWGEARGESTAGRLAVGSVIQNRLRSKRWGLTWTEVCQAPQQFSCWNESDINRPAMLAIFQDAHVRPHDLLVRECYWIADGLMADAILPQVKVATHYYATWMPKPPAWAKAGRVVATIGNHVFLEGVS